MTKCQSCRQLKWPKTFKKHCKTQTFCCIMRVPPLPHVCVVCVCVCMGLPHLDLILALELPSMSSRNPFRAGSRQMNVSYAYLVWVPKEATFRLGEREVLRGGRGAGSVRNELNYYANVTSVRKCFPLCVCAVHKQNTWKSVPGTSWWRRAAAGEKMEVEGKRR